MATLSPEPVIDTWFDVRFQCPKCRRFVSESAVESEDFRDASEYYGIRTETWTNCPKCGRVDDYCLVPVAEHAIGGAE